MYFKISQTIHGWVVAINKDPFVYLQNCDLYTFSNKQDLQRFLENDLLNIAEKFLFDAENRQIGE